MLHDHVIPKPPTLGAYTSHQLLEGLTDGARPLFVDNGDHLLVRSANPSLTQSSKPVRSVSVGDVLGFELRTSCGVKVKGKHRYFPLKDWRARRAWLDRRASGFEVLTVTVSARSAQVKENVRIDQTDFAGVLRVTDLEAFNQILANGIGGPGKAFGHGMLVI